MPGRQLRLLSGNFAKRHHLKPLSCCHLEKLANQFHNEGFTACLSIGPTIEVMQKKDTTALHPDALTDCLRGGRFDPSIPAVDRPPSGAEAGASHQQRR